GRIMLTAKNTAGEVLIQVSDDGDGINPAVILKKARAKGLLTKSDAEYSDKEIFSLIMLPGFSTNTSVTEFSGRGVGMDVVKKNIEKVGGSISIESKLGKGTTFNLKIPLTLAIVDGMEISVGGSIMTIPITSIRESFKIAAKQIIKDVNGNEMVMIRGECYPVVRLYEAFGIETAVQSILDGIIVLVETEDKAVCLLADQLIGEQQVVVKPLPSYLNKFSVKECGIAGCTILGDGSISLILDIKNLIANN
ncbi:MAG: chemotaxis protein CheA, partial [Acetanaerobacterium sp.]